MAVKKIGLAAMIWLLFVPIGLIDQAEGAAAGKEPSVLGQRVIAIDPGHGGEDPGVWDKAFNIKEKDITLAVSFQLKEILVEKGATVIMVRETDTDYVLPYELRGGKTRKRSDLERRIELIKEGGAGILVSLHVNASERRDCGGAEVFYEPSSMAARSLAQCVQEQLRQIPAMVKRIPKTANFYILRSSPVPAVLVEMGYLTYPPEREKLVTASYQRQLAQAIATGIERYCAQPPSS